MKVGCLGPKNTYSHLATEKMYRDSNVTFLPSITDVIMSVVKGDIEKGVVPYENVYDGCIFETLDGLREFNVFATMEYPFHVQHCIGVNDGFTHGLEGIEEILSKDKALSQCARVLRNICPGYKPISVQSSSDASRIVESNYSRKAALASKESLAGLTILAEDILPNNYTLFLGIEKGNSPKESINPKNGKTYFYVEPAKNESGSLLQLLKPFQSYNINLDSLHSRPDGVGGHIFYFEANASATSKNMRSAFDTIRNSENKLRVLGNVPNTDWRRSHED